MTVWKYLQDAELKTQYFGGAFFHYWGKFLERLGRRVITDTWREYANTLYPTCEVLSCDFIRGMTKAGVLKDKRVNEIIGDLLILVHLKTNKEKFEKHAVVFEIKSGISPIEEVHIKRWRRLLTEDPKIFVKKCSSIRLFVMWIQGIDINRRTLFYTLKEVILDELPPPDELQSPLSSTPHTQLSENLGDSQSDLPPNSKEERR